MCTGMATVRRLNGTDISVTDEFVTVRRLNGTDISVTDEFVTDGGDVTTVGGEDTGVIRDSHWRDA